MSLITGSIKSILSIKIKHRHDSYSDQISRIFVAKSFMVASLVIGVDWFRDNVFCTLPKNSIINEDFVHKACWIQGFYIYPQMENYADRSAYYGIPQYVEIDGIRKDNMDLCKTRKKLYELDKMCTPMEKYYFSHYQWMPFYMASLSTLFYLPYVLYRLINADIISLRQHLKNSKTEVNDIVDNYFNRELNTKRKMRYRIFANILIKCAYVGINAFTFNLLNHILNHRYRDYGVNWLKWLQYNSSMALNYNLRKIPTPGNKMLPTFGYCDVHELAMDGESAIDNKNKVLCEISSNILYQYVLMVIWFVLILSITASIIGVFVYILTHLINIFYLVRSEKNSKFIYRFLTFRECEYLEFIRQRNLALYGNVVREINAKIVLNSNTIPTNNHIANNKQMATNETIKNNIKENDLMFIMAKKEGKTQTLNGIPGRLNSYETNA
ncbi:uncharacterized protein LOC124811021 [Hydra vulgaris]|uniref:uncharacterized protein LOC124811021 n=1 Tax=Hydra vulgaris TaxID=6087 RepID=UPI001F5E67CF|nr:uncharacterized protein LOC124811021 [Hydra vulgaris]